MTTRLSVNINKIALIRNSRGENQPNLIQVAQDCERYGAEGITVHPRPDQRHIRFTDIPLLKEIVTTEFNIEGYPSPEFIQLVLDNKPDQVTLVPDPPNALTSDTGWDVFAQEKILSEVIPMFKSAGVRVSLFLNPIAAYLDQVKLLGADRIELYTGHYARTYAKDRDQAVETHRETSLRAREMGLGLNAGHDLNLENLAYYQSNVVNLLEVSIGHALICDALYVGLENAIGMYKAALRTSY